jgi:hypothetical protein
LEGVGTALFNSWDSLWSWRGPIAFRVQSPSLKGANLTRLLIWVVGTDHPVSLIVADHRVVAPFRDTSVFSDMHLKELVTNKFDSLVRRL